MTSERMLSRSAWCLAALASAVLAGACARSDATLHDESLPAGPHHVAVTITDDGFRYGQPIPAGRIIFEVRNMAREAHQLTLLPLPEDMPPLSAQLRGPARIPLLPFAGVPSRQPGTGGAFAVDLAPGRRYALVCLLHDANGESHARNGMNAEFRTTLVSEGRVGLGADESRTW